jgi:hypothetical protein
LKSNPASRFNNPKYEAAMKGAVLDAIQYAHIFVLFDVISDLIDEQDGYRSLAPQTISRVRNLAKARESLAARESTEAVSTEMQAAKSPSSSSRGNKQGRAQTPRKVDASSKTSSDSANTAATPAGRKRSTSWTDPALRRVIEGLISGQPNYQEMTTSLAEIYRQFLPSLRREHQKLGNIRYIDFLGAGGYGEDVYSVEHERGSSRWHIQLTRRRKITMATRYEEPIG